jgi:hypothetical protein
VPFVTFLSYEGRVALVEDMLKGNLVVALAIGATALVLPKVLPDLSPPLRSAVKGGLSLFLESESEAEGGIISRLADNALKQVLSGLSGPGPEDERQGAAKAAIKAFKKTARARARRYGRNESDRSTRYHRHIAALNHKMRTARSRHADPKTAALQDLSEMLVDPDIT